MTSTEGLEVALIKSLMHTLNDMAAQHAKAAEVCAFNLVDRVQEVCAVIGFAEGQWQEVTDLHYWCSTRDLLSTFHFEWKCIIALHVQFLRENNKKPSREDSMDRQSQSMWHQWQQRLKAESGASGGGKTAAAGGDIGGPGGRGWGAEGGMLEGTSRDREGIDGDEAFDLVEHEPEVG